jgi:tetratricopeptide (TPR) repeat protein
MRRVTTRSGGLAVVAAGAVVMGGAGWLRSPAWAAGGVLAGPFIALAAYAGLLTFLGPDPEELLEQCRWQDALAEADGHLPSRRWLAATSPGVFSDLLAVTLKQRAKALRGLRRYAEALPPAGEAVAIFRSLAAAKPRYAADLADGLCLLVTLQTATENPEQAVATAAEAVGAYRDLAAARPGQFLPLLAKALTDQATALSWAGRDDDALSSAREAERIYDDTSAWRQHPDDAAAAWLCEALILARGSRHRDAVRSLARAWQIPGQCDRPQPDFLKQAITALHLAYQDQFTSAWRAETGTDPPL